MEEPRIIWCTTLLLAAIAGYCDTLTFVSADAVFSAHVTGNFIVFAYQLVKGSDIHAWVKLLTFPVFIVSVMTGGRIAGSPAGKNLLLCTEGLLLTLAGALAFINLQWGIFPQGTWVMYLLVMIIVFAMGLQNSFGKIFSKETHGPTTMMTGNVTQAALDLGTLFKTGFKEKQVLSSLYKQLVTIGGFLAGCLLGALAGKTFELSAAVFPGMAMLIFYYSILKKRTGTP